MNDFEKLLDAERASVERFVRFRLNSKADADDVLLDELTDSRRGISEVYTVRDTWRLLEDKDKQILYLYFWKEMPQTEIAKQLNIPIGRVISIEQAQLLRARTRNSCWISLEDILLQLMERVMILSAITYVHWYDCITDYIL